MRPHGVGRSGRLPVLVVVSAAAAAATACGGIERGALVGAPEAADDPVAHDTEED